MAERRDFDDFLPAARREFRTFYSTATASDAVLMDVFLLLAEPTYSCSDSI
jgi:hypothetical protein